MFGNNKKIEEIQQLLTDLSTRIQSQNIEIAKLKESNDELTAELDDSRNNLKALSEELRIVTESFNQADSEVRAEITDLKLFLSKAKKDLVNDLNAEFSREMKEATNSIYNDLESFRELKTKAEGLKNDFGEIKCEIIKFLEIASKIKQSDFQLERYAKLLEEGDKEKLDLMRKIDTMERLVAKQRRIK